MGKIIICKINFKLKIYPILLASVKQVPIYMLITKYNAPSILKNTAHVDFKEKSLDNLRYVKVISLLAINQHLTPKHYVDDAIGEVFLDRRNQDNDFNNFNLTNIVSINLKTQAVKDNQFTIKSYVDNFPREYEQSRKEVFFYMRKSQLEITLVMN